MTTKEDIAYKIIQESFSEILFSCPFLSSIFSHFEYMSIDMDEIMMGAAGTDGKTIFYIPDTLIQLYKKSPKLVYRLFLHSVLHTLLKHMFMKWYDPKKRDIFLYNMAMDVIVEKLIDDIGAPEFSDGNEEQRKALTKYLQLDFKHVCSWVVSMLESKKNTQLLIDLFARDMHILWEDNLKNTETHSSNEDGKKDDAEEEQSDDKHEQQNEDSSNEEDGNDSDEKQNEDDSSKQHQDNNEYGKEFPEQDGVDNKDGSKSKGSNQKGDMSGSSIDDCNILYSNPRAGRQLSMNVNGVDLNELESTIMMIAMECKGQGGHVPSYLSKILELTLATTYDYKETLKKFMDYKEIMKVDIDSFDYIYYTFGLNKYNNIPLIEPLEYMDDRVVEDLVIAIDTSGSTYGEIVKRFLNETYGVVEQLEIGNRRINIHILQCDTAIRSAVKITSKVEFDNYIKNFRIYGGGGTDFRPVFEHVDELCKKKEFKKLKGLIYFTDGFGTFPEKRREYEVLFAIDDPRNNFNYKKVPSWAMYLRINDAMK